MIDECFEFIEPLHFISFLFARKRASKLQPSSVPGEAAQDSAVVRLLHSFAQILYQI